MNRLARVCFGLALLTCTFMPAITRVLAADSRRVALATVFGPLLRVEKPCIEAVDRFTKAWDSLTLDSITIQTMHSTDSAVQSACQTSSHHLLRYGATGDSIDAALPSILKGDGTVRDTILKMRMLALGSIGMAEEMEKYLASGQADISGVQSYEAVVTLALVDLQADYTKLGQAIAPPTPHATATSRPRATPTPAVSIPVPGPSDNGARVFPVLKDLAARWGQMPEANMHVLSPQDAPGSVKPLTRTEYDVKGSPLVYRVSVFRTAAEAHNALNTLVNHLAPGHQFLQSVYGGTTSNLHRLYTVTGYFVAADCYKNIEFVVSASITSSTANEVDRFSSRLGIRIDATFTPSDVNLEIDSASPNRVRIGDIVTVRGVLSGPAYLSVTNFQIEALLKNPDNPYSAQDARCGYGFIPSDMAYDTPVPLSEVPARSAKRTVYPRGYHWSIRFRIPPSMGHRKGDGRVQIPTPRASYSAWLVPYDGAGPCYPASPPSEIFPSGWKALFTVID